MSEDNSRATGMMAPLRIPLFRRIWFASLLSNFGLLIQGVGAAWAMTQLTSATDMIALVQTALMLPVMLVSIGAGAVADMYDRRKVGVLALCIALSGATGLTLATMAGLLTPWLLLFFCFAIGSGMALFGPAWQASVTEQVPGEMLPQAVALNSISFNIARSFGPAIGGVIVATAGAVAAFAVNALFYIPLVAVLLLWRREAVSSRLPPERLGRAMTSGFRYISNAPPIRIVLARTFVTGLAGGSISALMPVVARDLLGGGALTYGVILGAFGMGAVTGALYIARIRQSFSGEQAVAFCALIMAAGTAVVASSPWMLLSIIALFIAGAAWMIAVTMFNIGIQLSAPRWVAGRMLAAFQAAIAGGIAIGSWIWGHVANDHGVGHALLLSAGAMALTAVIGRWLRMPPVEEHDQTPIKLSDLEPALALTPRSGPIMIVIDYRVDPAQARDFYGVMHKLHLSRHRNGAYNWSLARDVTDPWLWSEQFHYPTWLDYLRYRTRFSGADIELHNQAAEFHVGPEPLIIRRLLERPFGSVRWKEDAPDAGLREVLPVSPTGLGGG